MCVHSYVYTQQLYEYNTEFQYLMLKVTVCLHVTVDASIVTCMSWSYNSFPFTTIVVAELAISIVYAHLLGHPYSICVCVQVAS